MHRNKWQLLRHYNFKNLCEQTVFYTLYIKDYNTPNAIHHSQLPFKICYSAAPCSLFDVLLLFSNVATALKTH